MTRTELYELVNEAGALNQSAYSADLAVAGDIDRANATTRYEAELAFYEARDTARTHDYDQETQRIRQIVLAGMRVLLTRA